MIEFKYNQDIFKTECEVIVNPVNCVGVMGKEIALQVKTKYPEVFKRYKKHLRQKDVKTGFVANNKN